jgi:hypothetical protein
LEELDLSHCELKGVLNLDHLSEKCTKLKRLNILQFYPKIKYSNIDSVIASPSAFESLEELSLSFREFGSNLMILLIAK